MAHRSPPWLLLRSLIVLVLLATSLASADGRRASSGDQASVGTLPDSPPHASLLAKGAASPLSRPLGSPSGQAGGKKKGPIYKHETLNPAVDLGLRARALAASTPGWQGQYFANPTLSGAPALTRTDPTIDFDWGVGGSPDPLIPSTNFSVRWTNTLSFAAGTYRFDTYTDDGVRLYVDGTLLIDHFVGQAPTEWQADTPLTAGNHTVVMEYFQGYGGALARLTYGAVGGTLDPGTWKGEYFGNPTLTGLPVFTRGDPAINFDWQGGAPILGFPATNFSVRWTRTLTLSGGTYRFATDTDDGARLSIDGVVVLDHFVAQPETIYAIDVPLAAGNHTVVMEYFQGYGADIARLNWALHATAGVVRINAGGGDYADSFNNFWNADQYSTGTSLTSEQNQPIFNTVDNPLFINERAGRQFGYALPLPNGNYVVRLHFVELYFTAPGVRRFNLSIQGTQVLSSFDIYAQAGHSSLITTSFPATVTNGTLSIAFQTIFDNAEVTAIDIYPANAGVDLTAPTFSPIPEPENATYTTPPNVTLSVSDNVALNNGYARVDDQDPLPLFTNLGHAAFGGQYTLPLDVFNALPLGSHVLSFGANDTFGNAWTQTWHFRKLLTGSGSVPIVFNTHLLLDTTTPGASAFHFPTGLHFGPDGRLYETQLDGHIHIISLDANHNVTAIQRVNTIYTTPNTNTDGSPAPSVLGRHVLGLDFDPSSTPNRPIIWLVSSDPRFCFNQTPTSCTVNTDSGILTRLIGPNFDDPANRTDFVTGIPRSRENHGPNAVHFGPDGWLYMTIGSDTNYGAPSTAFSFMPERYLTASVVRFNVDGAPGAFPLDLRRVAGSADLLPGVFEQYANGFRNAYDFLWHSTGNLLVNVNSGNFTAGNTPGPADGCPNGFSFDPGTRADYLALVRQGDFGGNPNPTHGQCVLDDGIMYATPLPPDPNFHPENRLVFYTNGVSPDGMTEYTAPTFGGQLLHNVITTLYAGDQSVRRVVLAPDGKSVQYEENLGIFSQPLGVAAGSDGAIYVAEAGKSDIQIMVPNPPLTGTWDFKASLPIPTQELGVVACNGKVYALGGLTGPSLDTNNAWIYDPAANTWSAAAPYPGTPLDHVGAACVNGKVYLLGGLIRVGAPVNTVYRYDPGTNAWTQMANLPTARGAMGVAVLNGKIYAAGGIGYPAKTDFAAYDPAANSWQTLAPMLTARDHLVLAASGGKLYAIGGRNVTVTSVLATNEMYDPATNTWATRAPMPTARGGSAVAALNNRIQVWGGEGPSGTPTSTYPQGEDYDPVTNTWIEIAGEPTPRHGTNAAVIGDIAYVPGGGPQTGVSVTDANEVFSYISTAPPPQTCATNLTIDNDGDAYTDPLEIDSSDPCYKATLPLENDDDDHDGIPDSQDQYLYDAANGTNTTLPWVQNWNPGDPPAGALGNSGFTGLQLSSHGGYIANDVHVGGAGGYLTLNATAGSNLGSTNSQDNALQVGFDARQAVTIQTRIADPLSGQVVTPGKSGGIFFGLDQDNYAKLVLSTDNSTGNTGLVFAVETNGTYVANPSITPLNLVLPGPSTLDLFLALDPATGRITARYRVDSNDPAAIISLGTIDATAFPGLAGFFKLGAAAGVLSTDTASSPFGVAYDYFRIDPGAATPPTSTVTATGTPPISTVTATSTATVTGTPTTTPTSTGTATQTNTPGPVASSTGTATSTVSASPTTTATGTPTPTGTAVATVTGTTTATTTPTSTLASPMTSTPTSTGTATQTSTPGSVASSTSTSTTTSTVTASPSGTGTPTSTGTPAATATATTTATATPTSTGGTTLFSDTFAADSLGAPPAGWTATNGTWTVIQDGTHVVKQSKISTSVLELSAGSMSWTDYTLSVDAIAPAGTVFFGITGRRLDGNNTYMLVLKNGNLWQLGKRVGGIFTQLAAGPFTYTAGSRYTFKLIFRGPLISAYINGTILRTVSDVSLSHGQISLRTSSTPEYTNVLVTNP